jgi:hypothetical protein
MVPEVKERLALVKSQISFAALEDFDTEVDVSRAKETIRHYI